MTQNRAAPADIVSGPFSDLAALPAPVSAIRAKILAAVATGDIEAVRIPIDWNEVRPLFAKSGSFKAGVDPIEILKTLSFDGKGREILQLIRAAFAQPFVTIKRGQTLLYEWPAFSRLPSPPADEREQRARWRCVRFADLERSNREGRPRAMRLGLSADGVWHYFWSED